MAGYEISASRIYFAPKIFIGYRKLDSKHPSYPLGGTIDESKDFFEKSENQFNAGLGADFGIRVFKGLSIFTGPSVEYSTGDTFLSFIHYNWGIYWNVGLAYRISQLKVALSYNQLLTNQFAARLNPIKIGVYYYF